MWVLVGSHGVRANSKSEWDFNLTGGPEDCSFTTLDAHPCLSECWQAGWDSPMTFNRAISPEGKSESPASKECAQLLLGWSLAMSCLSYFFLTWKKKKSHNIISNSRPTARGLGPRTFPCWVCVFFQCLSELAVGSPLVRPLPQSNSSKTLCVKWLDILYCPLVWMWVWKVDSWLRHQQTPENLNMAMEDR